MQLSDATLNEIAAIHDPEGVLSIFIDASPDRQVGQPPQYEVSVRAALRRLADRLHEEGPKERWRALSERLRDLEPDLQRLLDNGEPGRGRALFAKLSGGDPESLAVQVPLPDDVVLDPHAYVRPLVAALNSGAPVGVVAVSKDGARCVDLRLGEARDVAHFRFDEPREVDYQGGEFEGPGTNTGSARDEWQDWIAKALGRFMHSVGQDVVDLAHGQGWRTVFLIGDARLTHAVAERLQKPNNGYQVIEREHVLEWQTADEIARHLEPELDGLRKQYEQELVTRLHNEAFGRGAGALGLRDTLEALNEARVAHLVLQDGRRFAGSRAPDGRLGAAGEPPVGVEPDELQDEPRLDERMIERALETSAHVTLLRMPGDGPGLLDEQEGVGAILRW